MRKKLILLALALLPAATPVGAAPVRAAENPVRELLERARLWEARGRDDLARQSLKKLFLISPDNPDALAEIGLLDARTGNLAEAGKMLDRLRNVAPNHDAVTRIGDLLRLYGPDKDKLRQARLLASSGRKAEALARFRELYTNGPPDGNLALEYWQLVSDTPQGYEPARQGLSKLSRENPENQEYRLALAKLETSRLPLNRKALDVLVALSRVPAYAREAKAAWRSAVLRAGDDFSSIPLLEAYLEKDPEDSAVRRQLGSTLKARSRAVKAAEEKKRLESDPYYQAVQAGLALLDQGRLDEAEGPLNYALSGRPKDADALGGMGLLRFRQGHDFEAQAYFLEAMRQDPSRNDKWIPLLDASKFWGLMKEYGDAEKAGETDLAEAKLRQALTVDPNEPDAIAALGHILDRRGNGMDAEKAYRKALGIQPENASALGGLVALFLKAGRSADAEKLLSGLSEKQKSALGSSFNSLKSGMLRQEADRLAAHGDSKGATRALEEAAATDPDDPWLRYDLAKYYSPGKAQALFDDYFKKHPEEPAGRYAFALFLSSRNEDEEALAALDRIPKPRVDEKIASFRKRILIRIGSRQAKALFASGEKEKAARLLLQMEGEAEGDIDLETDVAYDWTDIGEAAHAMKILENLEAGSASLPASWHLRYANFLDRIDAQDELSRELERITGNLSPDQSLSLKKLKESLAVGKSESLRKAGKPGDARQALAPFIRGNPGGARLLLEDAKIALDENRPSSAEEDYRHVLAADPSNADALDGLISLYLKTNRADEAGQWLANLSEKQKSALGKSFHSLKAGMLRQEAGRLAAQGNALAATKKLEEAVATDPDDPWLRFDLGKYYSREKALTLFEDYFAKHPTDPEGRYAYALVQSSRDEDENALATLDSIPDAQKSGKIMAFRTELVETMAVRQSEASLRNGRPEEARNRLIPILKTNPESPPLLLAMADIDRREKQPAAAEALYRQILSGHPDEKRAKSGLVEVLIEQGHLLKALDLVEQWLAEKSDTQARLEEIAIFMDLDDYPSARKKLGGLLKQEPQNAEALAYAEKIASHENPAVEPYPVAKLMDNNLPPWLRKAEKAPEKRLSESDARSLDDSVPWLSAAADYRSRTGTSGTSRFASVEIPLEWKTPLDSSRQVFLRSDAVKLDAGTAASNTTSFGTQLLCQPNCPFASQSANGVSFTAGLSRGRDLRLDIGSTPLGFPVTHLVGGILAKGDLGPFSYSIDLSRRPLTSTLLSYAGTKDPGTGLTWGGVVATGPRFGLSLDNGGAFGAWSSLEFHKLTGVNVANNRRKRLMAGGYWRAINEDDMELSLGLTGMYWKYSVDAGEFTFGHGGYYSPQRYASLSVPVSLSQRVSKFSYMLRASVSTSRSAFDSAPYYPTSQAFQAQGKRFYGASSGSGQGYSFLADWEYLVVPEFYLGGQFNIERSDYYAPNRLLFYLRHPMGGEGARRVSLPPELFEPTSQF